MNPSRRRLYLMIACIWVAAVTQTSARAISSIPQDSVYQLAIDLQDQDGRWLKLGALRGQPYLVTMFYTNCAYVCPMIIETMKEMQAQLEPNQQQRLKLLMVSLDPQRDDVTTLHRVINQRQLDTRHWILARANTQSVRKLAALLGVQYRQLKNGDFNHSTVISLVDTDGRVRAQTSQLGEVDKNFMVTLKKLMTESTL